MHAGGAPQAGGWLGRVYLLDWSPAGVDRFVSLGSPHAPPPEGVLDQTRGILTYCSQACPGAFHPTVSEIIPPLSKRHPDGSHVRPSCDANSCAYWRWERPWLMAELCGTKPTSMHACAARKRGGCFQRLPWRVVPCIGFMHACRCST